MINENHWQENTWFEQKLAAIKPLVLRDIQAEILNEMQSPPMLQQRWQSFWQKTKSLLQVGVCCFLLGALAMFGIMTCFFDHEPARSRPLLAHQRSQIVTMPFRLSDLDGVNSPAALAKKIRQQPVVVIERTTTESGYTQYELKQKFYELQ